MTSSIIGIDIDTQQKIEILKSSRLQNLYCIGSPGTGKTGLFDNLFIQDCIQDLGALFIDPHGDVTQSILSRIPDRRLSDVIFLNFPENTHPFGLNLLECSNPLDELQVQYTLSQVQHVFEKAYGISPMTPRLYDYLTNCAYTLIVNPGATLLDVIPLLTNPGFRLSMLKQVKKSEVLVFWDYYNGLSPFKQHEEQREMLNKFNDFSFPPLRAIIGQSKSTINFRQIMDERKIVLVKLDARLDNATSLIGSTIIALLLNAAYSRENIPMDKRKQFHVYADEFQRFATEDFSTLITEGRKYGIGCSLANQNLEQLDKKNKAAVKGCANLVVFRISGDDANELKYEFKADPQPTEPRLEQKRATVKDPIAWLCTKGHSNEKIRQFTDYLLMQFYRKYVDQRYKHVKQYEESYQYLTKFYYDAMLCHYTGENPGLTNSFPKEVFLDLAKNYGRYPFNEFEKVWFLVKTEEDIEDVRFIPFIGFYERIYASDYYEQYFNEVEKGLMDIYKMSSGEASAQISKYLRLMGDIHGLKLYLSEYPIEEYAGQFEEKPGLPEPIINAQNRIANELSGLPKYTAKVKVLGADGKPVEYMIVTYKPVNGSDRLAVDRSIAIKVQNLQDGYLRHREDVEKEIGERQEQFRIVSLYAKNEPFDKKPFMQQKPVDKPTPTRSRIVEFDVKDAPMIMKLCPSCGNEVGISANFCQQCGQKLLQ